MPMLTCIRSAHAKTRHNGNNSLQRPNSLQSWFTWNMTGQSTWLHMFSRCRWNLQFLSGCSLHGLGRRMQTLVSAEARGSVPVGHTFQRRRRCRGPRRFLRTSANGRLFISPRTNRSTIDHKRNTWKSCQSNGGATQGNMNFNFFQTCLRGRLLCRSRRPIAAVLVEKLNDNNIAVLRTQDLWLRCNNGIGLLFSVLFSGVSNF